MTKIKIIVGCESIFLEKEITEVICLGKNLSIATISEEKFLIPGTFSIENGFIKTRGGSLNANHIESCLDKHYGTECWELINHNQP